MKIFKSFFCLAIAATICLHFKAAAQPKTATNNGNLFSAGYAAAFIGGLYDSFYPYKKLKLHGDFGLGAPASLDGEMLMLNGKLYQTRFTGKNTLMADTGKTPYALVCFFHAGKIYKPGKPMTKPALFHYLDSVLNNQNAIYAIHITGSYSYIKTRAFPPVQQKPYLPLAAMLDKQHFFEYHSINGDLVGYRTPAFMEGPLIGGYHFHFLSDKKDRGGHMTDMVTGNITIEVDMLNSYTIEIPQTADYKNFDFKKDRKGEIKSVENGSKQ